MLVLGAPFISDLRTALIAFGVEIALAPMVLGVGRPPWRRLLPGLFAVASVAFSNWLLSPGREVSTGALAGLRVAFFVVPGVLLASRIDPSALGDHLGQRLRLPARPVVAAVAALHRFEGLGEHWDQLASHPPGARAGPGPFAAGSWASVRGADLRAAHRDAAPGRADGGGDGSARLLGRRPSAAVTPAAVTPAAVTQAPRRTWAEPAPWRPTDSLMLALGLVVAAIPVFVSRCSLASAPARCHSLTGGSLRALFCEPGEEIPSGPPDEQESHVPFTRTSSHRCPRRVVLATGTGVVMTGGISQAASHGPTMNIQVLSFNDFHGNLEPPSGSSGRVVTDHALNAPPASRPSP